MGHVGGNVDVVARLERIPGSTLDRLAAQFIGSAGFSGDDAAARQDNTFAGFNHNEIRFLGMYLGLRRTYAMNHDCGVHQSLHADMRLGVDVGRQLLIDAFDLGRVPKNNPIWIRRPERGSACQDQERHCSHDGPVYYRKPYDCANPSGWSLRYSITGHRAIRRQAWKSTGGYLSRDSVVRRRLPPWPTRLRPRLWSIT